MLKQDQILLHLRASGKKICEHLRDLRER